MNGTLSKQVQKKPPKGVKVVALWAVPLLHIYMVLFPIKEKNKK